MEANALSGVDVEALLKTGEIPLGSFEDIPLEVLYLLAALLAG